MSEYTERWKTVHPKFLSAVADAVALEEPHHPSDTLAHVASATEAIERFVSSLYDNGLEITEAPER